VRHSVLRIARIPVVIAKKALFEGNGALAEGFQLAGSSMGPPLNGSENDKGPTRVV
jgi:hypothetical protein